MAESTRIDVDGAQTVAVTLALAGQRLETMAPDQVGSLIQSRSRAAAPHVTGRLRASLHAETGDGRVSVGSALEYAHVIHNGWAAHGIAANPFLIPVAEDSASVWGPLYFADAQRIVATTVKGA